MLVSVGEQGYSATVVADVIARAGASRKTFYEHFEDKRACFFALSDEIVEAWSSRIERIDVTEDECPCELDEGSLRDAGGGRRGVEALVGELFDLAHKRPAMLRVLATDLTAAGELGIERRERALERIARAFATALELRRSDEALVPRAIVGSILRLLSARARRGARVCRPRRGELMGMVPELADWVRCYRLIAAGTELADASRQEERIPVGGRAPGTLSLSSRVVERRGLPRGEGNVSRSFVVHNQRERILDALANLSAAKGYGASTIPEIVQEAAVSVQAFYEQFSGKEDAFLVAYELGHRKALAIMERAYESQEHWPAAVRAGIAALLEFLASEPAYAHLALIDALTASPKAMVVARDGMRAYSSMFEPGLGLGVGDRPQTGISIEATAGALLELCFVYVAAERARELPDLIDTATDLALRPFVGLGVS